MKLLPRNWFRWGLAGAALLTIGLMFALLPQGKLSRVIAAALNQGGLPIYGWEVCADLGIGPVPGVPGNVQRIELCSGSWRVQAYCIEPNKPAPALNALCSMVSASDFWCGDGVQQLREFQIVETPAPTPTNTFTPLPTLTSTPTQVPSPTPLPSQTTTPQVGTPQAGTSPTPSGPTVSAPQVTPTVFFRPHAGGPGNLLPAASGLAVLAGLFLLSAALWLGRRR